MSDHPKEAERNLKRIRICDDIYFDVFHLLAPAKVGLELALVSDRFDALVDTHFKSRKWTFGRLAIYSEEIVKENADGTTQKILPFPQEPLPISIVAFWSVDIWVAEHESVIDSDAIAFLQRIGRLLESVVCLDFNISAEFDWNIFATSVWPLLNVSAIIKIYFRHPSVFQNIRRLISPTILRDCSNLRFISCDYVNVLQFSPDDSKGSSDAQVLCKWLHTPRADGQPKVLKCRKKGSSFSMDALKVKFLSATTSVSFFIRSRVRVSEVSPSKLVNSLTREQLTIREIKNGDNFCWLIERSPINKSGQKWAEWEKEAVEDEEDDCKALGIVC